MGQSLFAGDTVIRIDDASSNKSLWAALGDWLPNVSADTTLVLCERTLDRRTKVYKWLRSNASIVECNNFSPANARAAQQWLANYAQEQGAHIPAALQQSMIDRATHAGETDDKPTIDQQQLAHAVQQLALVEGDVREDDIDAVLAPSQHENVFALLAAALTRDAPRVRDMIAGLRVQEDGYRVMGLLASQATNLAALAVLPAGMSIDDAARGIGAHPFAMKQLRSPAATLTRAQQRHAVAAIAHADSTAKQTGEDPWLLIETALLKISLN
jgi:DNA polymerase III delta subunit